MGKSLRLKHGWVAVVNRGQADINKRMSMTDARAREIEFFRSSDSYRWAAAFVRAACRAAALLQGSLVHAFELSSGAVGLLAVAPKLASAVCCCSSHPSGTLTTLAPPTWPTS
jgi:hypothetical protein